MREQLPSQSTKLVFDINTLAKIFLGQIARWNDQVISDLNPVLASSLPNASIIVVCSDASSEVTRIFTQAFSEANPLFASTVRCLLPILVS
jgi:phosphate transport system substrate-binding protein